MSRRFFVPSALLDAPGWQPLPDDVTRHAVRVLRLGDGDELLLCATDGRSAPAVLRRCDTTWGCERTGEVVLDEGPAQRVVWLIPALFKAHRFEWLLEKAAELGADVFAPFEGARSVVQWKADKAGRKVGRCERILLEAARQSKGVRPPLFLPPEPLAGRLEAARAAGMAVLWAHPGAGSTLAEVLRATPPEVGVALVTGPEGGFAPEELSLLQEHGAGVRLGRRVLRAETAPLAMLAIIRLLEA